MTSPINLYPRITKNDNRTWVVVFIGIMAIAIIWLATHLFKNPPAPPPENMNTHALTLTSEHKKIWRTHASIVQNKQQLLKTLYAIDDLLDDTIALSAIKYEPTQLSLRARVNHAPDALQFFEQIQQLPFITATKYDALTLNEANQFELNFSVQFKHPNHTLSDKAIATKLLEYYQTPPNSPTFQVQQLSNLAHSHTIEIAYIKKIKTKKSKEQRWSLSLKGQSNHLFAVMDTLMRQHHALYFSHWQLAANNTHAHQPYTLNAQLVLSGNTLLADKNILTQLAEKNNTRSDDVTNAVAVLNLPVQHTLEAWPILPQSAMNTEHASQHLQLLGIISRQNKTMAVIRIKNGKIKRLQVGDTLPNVRIIVADIADNSVTLWETNQISKHHWQSREVILSMYKRS